MIDHQIILHSPTSLSNKKRLSVDMLSVVPAENHQEKKPSHCTRFKPFYILLTLALLVSGALIGLSAKLQVGIFHRNNFKPKNTNKANLPPPINPVDPQASSSSQPPSQPPSTNALLNTPGNTQPINSFTGAQSQQSISAITGISSGSVWGSQSELSSTDERSRTPNTLTSLSQQSGVTETTATDKTSSKEFDSGSPREEDSTNTEPQSGGKYYSKNLDTEEEGEGEGEVIKGEYIAPN